MNVMNNIFLDIKIVAEFVDVHMKLEHIEGWLSPIECFALLKLAEVGPGVGEIVEIGSMLGKSTCWLATGSKKTHREKIIAIDHFIGSPEHQPGQQYECKTLSQEGTTFHKFIENLKSVELVDYIGPIQASSEEAAKNWKKAIRLLFIDGNHSYENTKQDFLLWSPFICNEGIICFHDVGEWEGCTKFYEELILSSKEVKEIGSVGTLRVVQKLKTI